MKHQIKRLSLLILIMVATTNLVIAEDAPFDFRKTRWGMNKSDVIKSEESDPIETGVNIEKFEYVAYKTIMAVNETHQIIILYYLVQDQLFAARYNIITEHSNNNDYLTDFEAFKTSISKKYGVAKEDTIWKDDLYKNDQPRWGTAIVMGRLEKYAYWETPTTKIKLQLKGDNAKVNFAIIYDTTRPELRQLVDQKNEQQQSF